MKLSLLGKSPRYKVDGLHLRYGSIRDINSVMSETMGVFDIAQKSPHISVKAFVLAMYLILGAISLT